jgi:hypothetical protein
MLVLTSCGGGTGERGARQDADLGFVPATYREGHRVVLPVVFTDGTRAELVYPPDLDIAGLGVFPYGSGRLRGNSPTPGRGDLVARDFVIRYGDLDEFLEVWNEGRPPRLLAQYDGADGQTVGCGTSGGATPPTTSPFSSAAGAFSSTTTSRPVR